MVDAAFCLYVTSRSIIPPKKFPLTVGGTEPKSNAWYLGPTRLTTPNGSSIDSAVLAKYTIIYGQTDRPTCTETVLYTNSPLRYRATNYCRRLLTALASFAVAARCCQHQTAHSPTVGVPCRNIPSPEFGTKFQREVPVFLENVLIPLKQK